MKIILNILIILNDIYYCDSSLYNWHVKTIERDSDFDNDLKVQSALNNERQQDLLKIAGKISNTDYDPNLYYKKQLNKNIFESDNIYKADIKDYYKFDKMFNSNTILPQNIQKIGKQEFKNKQKYNVNNHNDKMHENEYFNNREDDNNSYDNFKFLADHSLKIPPLHNNSFKSNELKEENNKTLKKNKDSSIINHCCEKYVDIENFVGTNLFDSTVKRCFSNEDVALLTIRKDFESLIPKNLPQCLFNDQMVALLLNYFYIIHHMIIRMPMLETNYLTQKAFYDTLGGYLNFYMVPVTKYSYYAGQISLNTAQKVLTLYKETKQFLNTNGNGWKASMQNVLEELKSIHIEPIRISELNQNTYNEFCMQLDMNTNENELEDDKMMVQLPKLEFDVRSDYLGNIWLPFKDKTTFDLKSDNSAYIVVKFYETITKCYRFEKTDQQYYNEQFKTWLLENINTHLSDEQFYPGLGAVLRICEYLKGMKQVLNISKDNFIAKINEDGNQINYQSSQINSKQMENIKKTKHKSFDRKYHINVTNEKLDKNNQSIESYDKKTDLNNRELTKNIDNIKLQADVRPEYLNTLAKLRTLDLTPPQIAVVLIPVIAIILIVIICCWKRFCMKKKLENPLVTKKNSSSSSSNLLNSPVRFFNIRKKSASSSIDANNKKPKKSVKIEKKPLRNSDTSISSSPVRLKKSKDSGWSKGKDSGKK